MILSLLARILGAAVTVYMLACAIRIFLTWVPRSDLGSAGRFLSSAVDPYLGFFARFRIFRVGRFDFSPIAALASLAVVNQVLITLAFAGAITVGGVAALVVEAIWSAFAFVLTFLALAALIRLIAYAARWNSLHPLWRVIDDMLNPILYRVTHLIWRDRIVNYLQGLATGLVVLLVFRIGGEALVGLIMRALRALPF
ncbi:MAG TPA: YggT family protein [Rectinemataceae bacterium]|nr:YggT family protein [Rectinemataceae bacterium]